ncbi:MAG: DUF2127 domain-containing protein [Polyangiales bacterium]
MSTEKQGGKQDWVIYLIAFFKLVKAAILIAIGVGALTLLHRDVAQTVDSWFTAIRADPHNHYFHGVIGKITGASDRDLAKVGVGTFFYAALFLIEGIGLFTRKRWAEWFTVIVTGSFIPLEIYELVRHFSIAKIAAIAINLAAVTYLVMRLRRERSHPRA